MTNESYCDLIEIGPQTYHCGLCHVTYKNITAPPLRVICKTKVEMKPPENPIPAEGAGTELKKLLAEWGITDVTDCGCERHANEMNARGIEWTRANIDLIVSWLENAANERGWLGTESSFAAKAKRKGFRWLAKRLVILAIKRAEATVAQTFSGP